MLFSKLPEYHARAALLESEARAAQAEVSGLHATLEPMRSKLSALKAEASEIVINLESPRWAEDRQQLEQRAQELDAEIANLTGQVEALEQRLAPVTARRDVFGPLATEAKRYLDGRPKPPAVKWPKLKAATRDALEQVRAQFAKLESEWQATEHAAPSLEEAEKNIDFALDQAAAAWAEYDPAKRLATSREPVKLHDIMYGPAFFAPMAYAHYGIAATTAREQTKAALMAKARDLPAGVKRLSDAERAKEFERLEKERWSLEVEEEATIRALEATGQQALRRPDARPEIVLAP